MSPSSSLSTNQGASVGVQLEPEAMDLADEELAPVIRLNTLAYLRSQLALRLEMEGNHVENVVHFCRPRIRWRSRSTIDFGKTCQNGGATPCVPTAGWPRCGDDDGLPLAAGGVGRRAPFMPVGSQTRCRPPRGRLSEHGECCRVGHWTAPWSDRGRAVMTAVSTNMAEIDAANAATASLAVGGACGARGGAATPAPSVNAVAPETPIAPMAPRPGEATTGLIEAGSSAGATFHTACRAPGRFRPALSPLVMPSAVAPALPGRPDHQLAAWPTKFASWADQMASHSATVAQAARIRSVLRPHPAETPRAPSSSPTHAAVGARAQMLMTGGLMGSEPSSCGMAITCNSSTPKLQLGCPICWSCRRRRRRHRRSPTSS